MNQETVKRRPGRPKKTVPDKETALIKETASETRRLPHGKNNQTAFAEISSPSDFASDKPAPTQTHALRHRRVGNPAFTGEAITATPSENAQYIMQGLRIANLPIIDLHDPKAVQDRIDEYFSIVLENGNKPTVAGLGNALNGMDRQTLWEIRTGNYRGGKIPYNLPMSVSDIIKRAYKIMEELWENYMQNGKINPVSGIFLGKNNYGYQDRTEYVLTPNQNSANDLSEKQILERYGIDSETAFDSDADSFDSDA